MTTSQTGVTSLYCARMCVCLCAHGTLCDIYIYISERPLSGLDHYIPRGNLCTRWRRRDKYSRSTNDVVVERITKRRSLVSRRPLAPFERINVYHIYVYIILLKSPPRRFRYITNRNSLVYWCVRTNRTYLHQCFRCRFLCTDVLAGRPFRVSNENQRTRSRQVQERSTVEKSPLAIAVSWLRLHTESRGLVFVAIFPILFRNHSHHRVFQNFPTW